MLFGKEFGDDAAKLANNIGELDRQLALVEGGQAKGSMQRESNIDKDSLSSQFLLLKTTAKNMFSDLGEPLRKPLMDVNDWFKRGIGWARKFIEAHPKLAAAFVKTAAVVTLVTVALGGMMIGVAAILGPFALLRFSLTMLGIKGPSVMGMLARSIKGVGTAIIWVGRMMLANPILAVVAAIAAAAIYIWMNWETLGPKFKRLWDSISAYTSEKWQAIKDYISGVWTSISGKASETWEEIKRAASSAAEKIGIGLKRGLDVITAPLRAVMDGFKWLLEKLDLLPQKNEALAQTNELLKNNPIAQKYGSVGEPAPTGYTANDMVIRFTGSSMKPVKAPNGGNFYYQPKIDLSVDARNNQNSKAVATDAVKALREHMQKDAAKARSNFSDRDLGWEL
ncbi:phage-related tail protein [Serratia marcescens]